MNKICVVTGTNGFIGSKISQNLKLLGYKVIEFEIDSHEWNPKIYEKRLFEVEEKVDYFFHLGAIASTYGHTLKNLMGFNFDATKIINKFVNENNSKLLFMSSAAVYGNNGSISDYGKSKLLAEQFLEKNAQVPTKIFRLFNTYGFNEINKKDMKSLISSLIIEALQKSKMSIWNMPGPYSGGYQSRDFIHVDDVVSIACEYMMTSNQSFEILDLGSGQNYKFIEIAEKIRLKINENLIIELIEPPANYSIDKYQLETRSNMEWILNFSNLKRPNNFDYHVLNLINSYKSILKNQ